MASPDLAGSLPPSSFSPESPAPADASPADVAVIDAPSMRRVSIAGLVGTTIEFFDFSVYAFLAAFFAPLFFATGNPTTAVLSALAVFGSSYLVRPLGGAFFGALGDRIGRRPVLMITILGMGVGSALIGFLPTYATIGIVAPLLLVLLRLVQGFCAGAEVMGAAVYVIESAPVKKRAIFGSVVPAGTYYGYVFAALIIAGTTAILGKDVMMDWGWRIPFLISAPLTLFCLWVRLKLEDSPAFATMVAKSKISKAPIREAVKGHWGNIIRVALLAIAISGPSFLGMVYLSVFLTTSKKLPTTSVLIMTAIVLALSSLFYPLSGVLAERFGRRPVIVWGAVGFLIITYPFMMIVDAATSVWVIGIAFFAFMAWTTILSGPAFSVFGELFPAKVRFTATAIGFNLGAVIAGGLGPYISGQLVAWTGNNLMPAFWVIGGCVLGLIVLWVTPETTGRDLAA